MVTLSAGRPMPLNSSTQAMAAAPAPLTANLISWMTRPRQLQRVDQRRRRDDGGAVLVVVEDRDIHDLAQALLDDEALRSLDVLEVDAAESGAQEAHAVDELVDILGVDLQIDAVDVGRSA